MAQRISPDPRKKEKNKKQKIGYKNGKKIPFIYLIIEISFQISQKLAKECKAYGEASYYDASTKTTVSCKAKDLNKRFFEISVFDENMKLLNKRIIEDK